MSSRWLIYHVASGQSFFTGAIAILLAVGMSPFVRGMGPRIARNLLALVGVIGVAVSSIPMTLVAAVMLVVSTVGWAVAEALRQRSPRRVLIVIRSIVALAWIAAIAIEVPYHLTPRIPPLATRAIGVIGDSITAGVEGPQAVTWPELLSVRTGITVRDGSRVGATTAAAQRQVAALSSEDRLVLIEIGGNELLGDTTPGRFAADLDALLGAVASPGRTLVMFELPLPPFCNRYGWHQRRLARKYGVALIPKRVLLGVLLSGGATIDSIHLSSGGHRAMADVVDVLLGRPRNRTDD